MRKSKPKKNAMLKVRARILEHLTVLREVIHDATSPVEDDLRTNARRLLVLFTLIPAVFMALGLMFYTLWVRA
jgi:hypothetical protein